MVHGVSKAETIGFDLGDLRETIAEISLRRTNVAFIFAVPSVKKLPILEDLMVFPRIGAFFR